MAKGNYTQYKKNGIAIEEIVETDTALNNLNNKFFSSHKIVYASSVRINYQGSFAYELSLLKQNGVKLGFPTRNQYNTWEEGIKLGEDLGYHLYDLNGNEQEIDCIKLGTNISRLWEGPLEITYSDSLYSNMSRVYIMHHSGSTYKVYSRVTHSSDLYKPKSDYLLGSFTVQPGNKNLILILLQAGGGGGGAPYGTNDGSGGGAGACAPVLLNLDKITFSNTDYNGVPAVYYISIGDRGSASGPGFSSYGGKGGDTYCYFLSRSDDSKLLASATGGTGGGEGYGGHMGSATIYSDYIGEYTFVPPCDPVYSKYTVVGVDHATIDWADLQDLNSSGNFYDLNEGKGGSQEKAGNSSRVIIYYSYYYSGGRPASKDSDNWLNIKLNGLGGKRFSGYDNQGGGGGGAPTGGSGGAGGTRDHQAGYNGSNGGGGGGARWTVGGKEGGYGGAGKIFIYY